MKTPMISILIAVLAVVSQQANAGVIAKYTVADFNGGNAQHGLWTANDYRDNTFEVQDGAFFTIFDNDGEVSAQLSGTATNNKKLAQIDLLFSDFKETYAYKREDGYNWNPSRDSVNDIDFFARMEGEIVIDGDIFHIDFCAACGYGFQFGMGANAKNANEMGGSAWVANQYQTGTQHWALNLSLSEVDVPEPSTLAILAVGIAGLVASRRTANKPNSHH